MGAGPSPHTGIPCLAARLIDGVGGVSPRIAAILGTPSGATERKSLLPVHDAPADQVQSCRDESQRQREWICAVHRVLPRARLHAACHMIRIPRRSTATAGLWRPARLKMSWHAFAGRMRHRPTQAYPLQAAANICPHTHPSHRPLHCLHRNDYLRVIRCVWTCDSCYLPCFDGLSVITPCVSFCATRVLRTHNTAPRPMDRRPATRLAPQQLAAHRKYSARDSPQLSSAAGSL